MIAWAVIDKSGNLKWWYQNDNLGTVDLEQFDVFRLKRHAELARKAWDKSSGKTHRVIRVEVQELP